MRFVLIIALLCAGPVFADTSRESRLQNGANVLEGRALRRSSRSINLQEPRVTIPGVTAPYVGPYSGPLIEMARSAARRHGIPEDLFLRLVQQESAWNPNAISPKGAIGLAQLMPGTARYLGVNPRDPAQNLEGGARYLKEQQREFGSWMLALAAYNAGPEAVRRYGGVPPYRETRNYVNVIWGNLR